MSHEKIFNNVSSAIERGKLTFEDAVKNIDNDNATYNGLIANLSRDTDLDKIVVFENYIAEGIELKKRLITKFN